MTFVLSLCQPNDYLPIFENYLFFKPNIILNKNVHKIMGLLGCLYFPQTH